MPLIVLLSCGILLFAPQQPQPNPKPKVRYSVEPDLLTYPQANPKEALNSVLKAINADHVKYLIAQLADPRWVDQRVKEVYGGKFQQLVSETNAKLAADRGSIKELQRFLTEGSWEMMDDTASSQLKDVPNRRVYMRRIEGRWFLESRQTPLEAKEK